MPDKLPSIYRYALEENFKFTSSVTSRANLREVAGFDSVYIRGEKNCNNCGGTGYSKRKPLIEIAEFNDAVKEEIYRDLAVLSNPSSLEEILISLSNFESLKIQSFNKLVNGEIDPPTYFNLSK